MDPGKTPNDTAPSPTLPAPLVLMEPATSSQTPIGTLPSQERAEALTHAPVDDFSHEIMLSVDEIGASFEDDEDRQASTEKEPARARL